MSAIITSEFANVKWRGMMMAAVFAMQGIGYLTGAVVMIIALVALKNQIINDVYYLDWVWRIMLAFGVVPALVAVYFRLTIPETPRYTVDVVGDEEKASNDVAKVLEMNAVADVSSSWKQDEEPTAPEKRIEVKSNTFADFVGHFGQWKNGKVLFAAAYCWFALDIAWYGLTINTPVILEAINYNGTGLGTWDSFYQKAIGQIIINLMGTVPGYWVTVATIEILGRKPIQFLGFGVLTVVLTIIAATWDQLNGDNKTPFIALFTIAQFFFNFGPNSTTFVVPGEVFPTRWRSTGHGISAACGKVGAILGIQAVAVFFSQDSTTPRIVLGTFAFAMATGFCATFLLPETKGKTLEELSQDNEVILSA
eukprot:jgi/Hompol1/3638/HPOL_006662-RA